MTASAAHGVERRRGLDSLRSAVLAALLLLIFPRVSAYSQAEHVPAAHPVYDFLTRMHVRGMTEGWSRSALPADRADVTARIRALGQHRTDLSDTELALLDRYTDEFVAEADGTQKPVLLFGSDGIGSALGASFSDREKFLYAWASPERATTFFMEFIGTAEYRTLVQESRRDAVVLGQVGGRFRGTVAGFIGYGLQSTNGSAFGDKDFARTDRVLRQNANFGDWHTDFFDFTEAYLSARWAWGSASFGKEPLLFGSGFGQRALVSANAPPFDAFRLNAHFGDFRFTFLHGTLLARKDTVENFRPFHDSKYIAYHRAEVDILDALRFGVSEAVIYSQRAPELSYLNPVNFWKSAEHASGDRDNPLLGFDLATLNLGGTEFYGSWILDDVDFSKWGTGWWGNKFVWQGGVLNETLLQDTRAGIEYTRIEPHTYTHVFRNNEYTNKGYSLGAELQPNSDEWFLHIRHWRGADLAVALSWQYRRHGANELGADSTLTRNHGGDINTPWVNGRDSDVARFLDGSRETEHIVTAGMRWEPVRNVILDGTWRYRMTTSGGETRRDHFLSLLLEILY